ncbi:MAG: hypothetical protein V4556_08465 [Bacteroidota bacterium]
MQNKTTQHVEDDPFNQTEKKTRSHKFLKKAVNLFIVTAFFLSANNSFAQSSGDYRSNAKNMNWSTAASWQKYNGTSWVTSADYPGQNTCTGCTVNIQHGDEVTLNISPANSVGNIFVGAGNGSNGTLTLGTFTLVDAGNLTVDKGADLNLATGTFTVGGTTSTAGTISDASNTGVNTFTGLVTKTAGAWTSTAVTDPANMIFAAGFTNTAGAFTAGAATIGDNKILTGTVNMSFANGISVLGNGDITIAGTATTGASFGGTAANYSVRNLTLTGRLTAFTTGNLTVNGTTSLTGTGSFVDNNNTGITTFTGSVTVGSSATFTATAITTVGGLIFAGGIIQHNTTALAFNVGTIRTSSTQTWSGSGDITSSGVIDVSAGVLTNNITGTVYVGGTLTGTALVQGASAKLSLGNTTPLSITTLTATATGNIVDYHSSGAATMRGQTYYNLTISGSGNKIIPTTDITVNGNLTITAGALSNTTNNKNIILAGNWINNVGAGGFAAGTGLVSFSGSSTQTLGGSSSTTFTNITIANAAGINQTMSATINGVLTFTSGVITTGATAVIISSTGSVSRTSGHINGNEQRNIAVGAAVSRTFDIGDATNYAPVTIVIASVSVAGNVTAKTTNTDHPSIPSSTLDGNLSINRYWTLTNSGTTFTNYSSTFNFVAGDKDGAANTSNLLVGNYNASWAYPTVGTRTSTSTQATNLTAFGNFVLAESAVQPGCATPTVVITNPSSICTPSTVDLTAAAVTSGSTGGLTFTYWSDAAASISLSTPSAVATSGTYYIKGTIAGGCNDIKPVVVSINSTTGNISGTAAICYGQSTTLSIAVTGVGPWSGTLSDGTSFGGTTSPLTVDVSPTSNTTYTISTLTDANCTAQVADMAGSAVITVAALPTTANAGADQNHCGLSATLNANAPSNGTGSWSIVSGSGGAFVDATDPTTLFSGSIGITYVLRWSITNSPCNISIDDVAIVFTGVTWIGSVNTDWNDGSNWCGGIVPANPDLSLPAGLANYPVLSGLATVSNLTIASGATLTIATGGSLSITGIYSNSGALANNGSILLNGSSAQNFPGSSATISSMKNLAVDNIAGVTIDKSFILTGTLTSTSGTIDLTDKIITLHSDSIATANVASVSGNFIYSAAGKFIVERYVPARRAWRLMTAPLTNANTIFNAWQNGGVYTPGKGTLITSPGGGNGLDAGAAVSFKFYNIPTQTLDPITNTNVSISNNTGSADNVGYYIFLRGDRNPSNLNVGAANNTTLSSAGHLQTGDQIFNGAPLAGKFNLVGNPYAARVDFDKVILSNMLKRFYAWDPTLNSVGGYVMLDDLDGDGVFSSSVGGSTQTKILESGQAFLVQTNLDGPSTITFTEDSKFVPLGGRGVAGIKNPTLKTNLFLVNGASTTLADGVMAEYNDNFSKMVTLEDAPKVDNDNENISFVRGNTTLAAERMPLPTDNDIMYYRLTQTTPGNYRFQISASKVNQKVSVAFLEDRYLNTSTEVDLNGVTNIDFIINSDPASASPDRFKLTFKKTTTATIENKRCEVTAYPNPLQNNRINLQFNNKPVGEYSIKLMNNFGQIVYTKRISISSPTMSQALVVPKILSKGTYRLEVKGTDNKRMIQQVIVQ